MSALSDKILSYNPEQYFRFNETPSGAPTNIGSGGQFNDYQEIVGTITLDATSGPDNQGSWRFYNNAKIRSEFQNNILHNTEFNDLDYTVGIWFKGSSNLFHSDPAYSDYTYFIAAGQAFGHIKPRLYIDTAFSNGLLQTEYSDALSVQGTASKTNINDGEWHYLAVRTFYSNVSTSTVRREWYVDGVMLNYAVSSGFPSTDFGTTIFGNLDGRTWPPDSYIEFAHYHVAPANTIESTAIAEIYNIGINPPLEVNFTTTIATATALMTEPTIIAVIADNVYVTTSFIANAILPPNVNVSNASNFNFYAPVFEASAEHPNNVDIATGSNISFAPTAAEASAELIKPFLAEFPMVASATIGNHIVSVDFSYFKLIKDKNPYIYLHDGLSAASTVNAGYGDNTITFGDITPSQDGGSPMNLLGNGFSWFSDGTSSTDHQIRFNAPSIEDSFMPIQQTGNWAAEVWIKNSGGVHDAIFIDTPAGLVSGFEGTTSPYGYEVELWLRNIDDPALDNLAYVTTNKPLTPNEWHHIVFQQEQLGPNTYQLQLWIDGSLYYALNQPPIRFTDPTGRRTNPAEVALYQDRFLTNNYSDPDYDVSWGGIARNQNIYVDEIVYYDRALSSAEITYHYEYVTLTSPDAIIYTLPIFADINFFGGSFFVESSINYQPLPSTAIANIVDPLIIPGIAKNVLAEPIFASSELLEPDVITDSINSVVIMSAFAEPGIPIFLNNVYAQYVLANYSPYRYANFDSSDVLQDLGSDADYAVPQIEYSGTVSEPGYGINNKSILTSGTYYTDGVRLLESEFDDTWGTGTNFYHSSFWMRRSVLDQSTTGLRVIWNLNGAYDNQHVILYQYQGNLVMQFNNGSGTYIENSVAGDLFDYNRHFVAINFDHTGANIFVELFIDGALAMSIDLGQYAGTTINGVTPIGPNDPAANKPRLGVGCLITPFIETALPVIPTNTRIYADEIVWSKTHLGLADATALYNAMPAQALVVVSADPFVVSAEMVDSTIIAERAVDAATAEASALIVEPLIIAQFNLVTTADAMLANAEIVDASASQTVLILSGPMIASGFFGGVLVSDFVNASPMTVNIEILEDTLEINGIRVNRVFSPWVTFLRATDIYTLMPYSEVK